MLKQRPIVHGDLIPMVQLILTPPSIIDFIADFVLSGVQSLYCIRLKLIKLLWVTDVHY